MVSLMAGRYKVSQKSVYRLPTLLTNAENTKLYVELTFMVKNSIFHTFDNTKKNDADIICWS